MRKHYAHKLEHPEQELFFKLLGSSEYAQSLEDVSKENTVYTSAKDSLEQEFSESKKHRQD